MLMRTLTWRVRATHERPTDGQRADLDGSGLGAKHIGRRSIGTGCSIGALAHIGQRVTMGPGCKIQGAAYIADDCSLGAGVFVGPAAVVLNDKFPPSGDRAKWQPVSIGDDAVIGGNATVIPGNNVGPRGVLAAGAVLTKTFQRERSGRKPAVFLMTRDEYDAKRGGHQTDERTAVAAFLKSATLTHTPPSSANKSVGTRRTFQSDRLH